MCLSATRSVLHPLMDRKTRYLNCSTRRSKLFSTCSLQTSHSKTGFSQFVSNETIHLPASVMKSRIQESSDHLRLSRLKCIVHFQLSAGLDHLQKCDWHICGRMLFSDHTQNTKFWWKNKIKSKLKRCSATILYFPFSLILVLKQ